MLVMATAADGEGRGVVAVRVVVVRRGRGLRGGLSDDQGTPTAADAQLRGRGVWTRAPCGRVVVGVVAWKRVKEGR